MIIEYLTMQNHNIERIPHDNDITVNKSDIDFNDINVLNFIV